MGSILFEVDKVLRTENRRNAIKYSESTRPKSSEHKIVGFQSFSNRTHKGMKSFTDYF
jgi:hypothetical protein